eukprot:364998-Chlamydomonas_euryale.AAC.2
MCELVLQHGAAGKDWHEKWWPAGRCCSQAAAPAAAPARCAAQVAAAGGAARRPRTVGAAGKAAGDAAARQSPAPRLATTPACRGCATVPRSAGTSAAAAAAPAAARPRRRRDQRSTWSTSWGYVPLEAWLPLGVRGTCLSAGST